MQFINGLFVVLAFIALLFLIIGIIKPTAFDKDGKEPKRITKSPRLDNLIVFGIIFLVLCGIASATDPSTPATKTVATTKTATSKPVSKPKQPTATKPATSTTPKPAPTPAPKPAEPVLTGYGATQAEWNKTHTEDKRFAANTAYDPEPNLAGGCNGDKYCAMQGTTDYEMSFPNSLDQAEVQTEIMQEFPSDTTVLWQQLNTSGEPSECYQMEVHSATLATVLGGDGDAAVEFDTQEPSDNSGNIDYKASNVNDVLVNDLDNPTPSDAPGC